MKFAFLCLSIYLGVGLAILHVPTAHAQGNFGNFEVQLPGVPKSIDKFISDNKDKAFLTYAQLIINYVTGAVIVAAVISFVAAGYIYMTAGGDASRLGTAKKLMLSALFAIFLALAAVLLLNTISPQFAAQLREPSFGAPK